MASYTSCPGKCNRAKVDVEQGSMGNTNRNVEVAMDQDCAFLPSRKESFVPKVTMGGIQLQTVDLQFNVIYHYGELQQHLIYFNVAISTDCNDPIIDSVQQGEYAGTAPITFGIVVQQVTQQQEFIRALTLESIQQFVCMTSGTMKV